MTNDEKIVRIKRKTGGTRFRKFIDVNKLAWFAETIAAHYEARR